MLRDMCALFLERKEFFLKLLWEHLEISMISILIAIVLGGLVGILISEYQQSAKPAMGVINFLYTIPSISMLGFLIPFSGVGNMTAVIALTIYALLPMVRNTHTGITNVDAAILEAAKGMGSTRMQILFKIKLPLAMPVIMSGIRNMVTMTIALAGIASFIGAGGLGVAIYRGITTNNVEMTMVGSLLIALLALLMDFILGFIEKRMKKRTAKAKRTNHILAAIALLACLGIIVGSVFAGREKDTLKIATKPMTEQYILGEMLDIMIEQDTNMKVEVTQGVGGGTSNIQPGMEKGEFDLYPEYTGTGWNMVLKKDGLYNEDLFKDMQKEYKEKLDKYQSKLSILQYEMYKKGIPSVFGFEGWDAGGKGGAIRRLTAALDPLGYSVNPVAAPNVVEKSFNYLWRFWTRFPKQGEIAIFDRTWYGRVMVERIEGFCTKQEWQRAYKEINDMEHDLASAGAIVLKFWMQIDKDEQERRFRARQENPDKQWKITDEDWRNREKWDQYEEAVNEMLIRTSTPDAPWIVVEGNCKYYARIKVLQTVVDAIEARLKEEKKKR